MDRAHPFGNDGEVCRRIVFRCEVHLADILFKQGSEEQEGDRAASHPVLCCRYLLLAKRARSGVVIELLCTVKLDVAKGVGGMVC